MLRLSTLLAIYVAVLAVPELLTQLEYTWWRSPGAVRFALTRSGISSVAGLVAAISLLVLSYFIFRRRDWARRGVIYSAMLLTFASALAWWGIWWQASESLVVQLRMFGGFIISLAVPLFLALFLCCQPVIAVFREPEAHERI